MRTRARKIKNDKFAVVIRRYLGTCPKFLAMAPSTQDNWRRQLTWFENPDNLGDVLVKDLRPSITQQCIDKLADRPGKQTVALTALRALEKWAIVREHIPHPITTGVEVVGSDGGHLPWRDEHVELVERYGREDIARAVTLKANTGQRGSDIVRMCSEHIELVSGRPGINVKQKKTGIELWIPFTLPLQRAVGAWKLPDVGLIVTKRDGRPWDRKALADAWMWERDHNPHLAPLKELGLVLHGLRGTACVRLYQSGANSRQISYMVGLSEEMVTRYLRFSVQKENALAAVQNLDRTPFVQGDLVTLRKPK